ncbi:hypothetical protein KR018_005494 [Drosophila ironensis]|nr:hypothetical protein KR018_005494 [Drosophila ironensis]
MACAKLWPNFRLNGFRGNDHVMEEKVITLGCQSDGYLHLKTNGTLLLSKSNVVHCRNGRYQVFESRTSMPYCGQYSTLRLGHDLGALGATVLADVCYDVAGAQLKFVSFTPTAPGEVLDEHSLLGQDIRMDPDQKFFKAASQSDVDAFWQASPQLSQLFGSGPFDYDSLVQDAQLSRHLAGAENILGTVWLHSLRTGNWRHWLSALREASGAGAHFAVRLGVSGSLKMPPLQAGQKPWILDIDLPDGGSLPVPAHIWAHVTALKPSDAADDQDEFVLVGHNTPFFRSDSVEDLCQSMCHQVSWLKDTPFASMHEFAINGRMQCCRVQDVARKLDGFFGGDKFTHEIATSTLAPA